MDYQKLNQQGMIAAHVPTEMQGQNGIACRHLQREIRRRTIKNGSVRRVTQCLRCGQQVNNDDPNVTANDFGKAWNVELESTFLDMRKRFSEIMRRIIEQAREKEQDDWRSLYQRHVSPDNPVWQDIRRRVMKRCDGICEGCMQAKAVHVHHLSYAHLGYELLFELRAVCLACHEKLHPHRFGDESQ